MAWPALSVIVINYNQGRFLPECLDAILAQSHRPHEVIFVDDCSTDDSVEIIERYARRHPVIRAVSNDRNQGFHFSVNRGLALASGDYVYCASADDRVLPGLFGKSMRLLARYPNAGLCSTLSAAMDEHGEYRGVVHTPLIARTECFVPPTRALKLLQRYGSWFMGNTAVYRRAALHEAGGHMAELGPYCDGFIVLVLALRYGACFIPEPLAVWRKIKNSYSHRTGVDVDRMLEITAAVKRLMVSKYSDLFPTDCVDDWERRRLFEVATSFVAVSAEVEVEGLRRLLRPSAGVDRAFLAALRLVRRAELLATKLYLFCRLQPHHLHSELARKLRHVVRPGVSPGSSSAGVRHGTTALGARRETGAPGSRAGDQPTLIRPNGSHGDG